MTKGLYPPPKNDKLAAQLRKKHLRYLMTTVARVALYYGLR